MPNRPRMVRPPGTPQKKQRKRLSSEDKRLRGPAGTRRRYRILARDGFRCQVCQRPQIEINLQVDHIIPLSHGGEDAAENLQAICIPCHAEKTRRERNQFV